MLPNVLGPRPLSRAGFAVVTLSLLLAEIALTRVFSGTIGYYFAFMSISIAMLGLGAGSLWVSLRGELTVDPDIRAGRAALAMGGTFAFAMLVYLVKYPIMNDPGNVGQAAYVAIFAVLFLPFLMGGVLISTVFEAGHREFGKLYAIDLIAAAVGCVIAAPILDRVSAPRAMFGVALLCALAGSLFFVGAGEKKQGLLAAILSLGVVGGGFGYAEKTDLFACKVIRGAEVEDLVLDRWNDFSRVVVRRGNFYTWGLSQRYEKKHEKQFDLLIEGVAGTQIQVFDGKNIEGMDFFQWDVSSLPHRIRPKGSTLVLGVGAGFDVMMAKHFGKDRIVGVEVNPLVGDIVNNHFGAYSGRPYHLPGVEIHFENARTFVKRDTATYDVVTVTWVDSGAATGAGAFALTENYLYTVEAFKDYIARLNDDGVLSFMRARYSPEYDAIKGIGIAVEAMRALGIKDPEKNIVVTSVRSPHFGWRELVQVMIKKKPFTEEELSRINTVRQDLWFSSLYTPGRTDGDPGITRLVTDTDRAALYASFPFDMEPTTDDRPFYFFLRAGNGRPAGSDVQVLRKSMITIGVLIGLFLIVPLIVLLRRGVANGTAFVSRTLYFSVLGLGFMLVEMKLLQQSVLIVGNPTLSLAAVLSALLLSTGIGALYSDKLSRSGDFEKRAPWIFVGLIVVLAIALVSAEPVAAALVGFSLPVRTAGLVLFLMPMGFFLGCPMALGMATLGEEKRLVAWSWGMNGLFGVAGSAISIYLAIHFGLRAAFLLGIACYLLATLLFVGVMRAGRSKIA